MAQIALKVRQYKKLFVTTEGQMFRNEPDAEEAVRVKNMIIDEPDDYIGIITMTEDMVNDEKLKTFAKDPGTFGKLFENAKIPRTKKEKKDTFERKRENVTPDDKAAIDSVASALGLAKTETPETPETPEVEKPTPAAEEKKSVFSASNTK